MPSSRPADHKIIRREEKVARLKEFACEAIGAHNDDADVAIVARSSDSPVIQAVTAALAQAGTATARVRMIIVNADMLGGDGCLHHLGEVRYALSSRLRDAHEQLVIGGHAWIGDAMRRDPDKIDSFERFVTDDDESAAWAALAFNRLWSTCETGLNYRPHDVHDAFDGMPPAGDALSGSRERMPYRN